MSLSFPVVSTPLEDKYSMLPDSFQVSSQRDMNIMTNPSTRQASPLGSGTRSVGHLFSSSSTFPNDVHISSVLHCERNSQNSLVTSHSSDGKSLPPIHPSHSDVQSTALVNHDEGNKDISWGSDLLQDYFDFPDFASIQNRQVESNAVITSGDQAEKTNWSEWDPLISIGDELDQFLPDLPCNYNATDSEPKQAQNYQQQPAQSGEYSTVPDSSSNAPNKTRMRWTQELHEAFVEAVNKLGGSERATPKGILNQMKVPGLTIYHVKSHLQKYRTARYKPETSEVNSEERSAQAEEVKSLDLKETMGITEALRLQMELQKRLHEQLEDQRKLQLQLEEQGKNLQKMFEQHKMMGMFNASTSTLDDPENAKLETPREDHAKTEIGSNHANASQDESSKDAREKQKVEATETCEEPEQRGNESGLPPTKRARTE
ncbi:hypothetical protein UlMin_030020 [Ulmus minor]